MADEVVASGYAPRDCVGDETASLLEGSGAPDIGGALTAVLLDLEPDSPERFVSTLMINKSGKRTKIRACSCCTPYLDTSPCK
jgi:hypothetical protein